MHHKKKKKKNPSDILLVFRLGIGGEGFVDVLSHFTDEKSDPQRLSDLNDTRASVLHGSPLSAHQ